MSGSGGRFWAPPAPDTPGYSAEPFCAPLGGRAGNPRSRWRRHRKPKIPGGGSHALVIVDHSTEIGPELQEGRQMNGVQGSAVRQEAGFRRP